MKSKFIVIDGNDGSGKGEVISRLINYLSKSHTVISTLEPSTSEYGKRIREILSNDKDPLNGTDEILDLFIKDREYHVTNEILPALQNDDTIVVCDRYYYSTIVYQAAQGIDVNRLIELNKDFLKPDLAFILDLPTEVSLNRISLRGQPKEKFEQKDFMEKIRSGFLNLINILDDNIIYIDASKTRDEVFDSVKKEIDKLLL